MKQDKTENSKNGTLLISAKIVESESKINQIKQNEMALELLLKKLKKLLNFDKIEEESYEEIYNLAYKICISKGGELLLKGFEKILNEYLDNTYVQNFNTNLDIFNKLVEVYDDYIIKISIIRKTLMYFENNYIIKNLKHVNFLSICKVKFSDRILNKNYKMISDYLHDGVKDDRENKLVDKVLIRKLINFLLEIDISAYENLFEKIYLKNLEDYYLAEYSNKILIMNLVEYIVYVKIQIENEESRAIDYGICKTHGKILQIMVTVLLLNFLKDDLLAIQYFKVIIREKNKESLKMLKDMVSINEVILCVFYDKFAKSLELFGKEMILQDKATALEDSKFKLIISLIDYILQIDLFRKCIDLSTEKAGTSKVNKHICCFINFIPELVANLIAKYLDYQFKLYKKSYSYDEMLSIMDKNIHLLRYVSDKDVFVASYRKYLSKRLLSGYYYLEIETTFLSKIKLECGSLFTFRCENMINDILNSKKTIIQFKESKESRDLNNSLMNISLNSNWQEKKVDLVLNVLSQSNWPLTTFECCMSPKLLISNFKSLDKSILEYIYQFNNYYETNFKGKQLTLILTLGSVDMVVNFKDKNYFLNLTSIQAFTLMHFNKIDEIDINFLVTIFNLKEKFIIFNHLIPLIKSGMIFTDKVCNLDFKKGEDRDKLEKEKIEELIQNVTKITLNRNFSFKQQKLIFKEFINLDNTNKVVSNTVTLERKNLLESTIIRVMKSKQIVEHNELISEVISGVNSFFVPEISAIKTRIENLIEREFIKRTENINKYMYIA